MYRLHCFGQSGNSYKVALMLTLCELPWAPVFVDFFKGETRSVAYRRDVNPMGEAPVLAFDGERLTQSGVILHRLVRATGRFGGRTEAEQDEIWRWILFDNHKFTSALASYRFLHAFARSADPAVLDWLKGRFEAAAAIVEARLAAVPFLAGESATIADLSLAGYLFYPVAETGIDIDATLPAIAAWRTRIRALPGWRGPYDLMPSARPA